MSIIALELNPINFLLLLPIAHVINMLLIAWVPHFLLHQKIWGIPIYKVHLYSHHQSNQSALQGHNWFAFLEHSLWFSMDVAFFIVYLILLTPWMAWLFIFEALLGMLAVYHVHSEFDNSNSWFKRYKWFIKARRLHQIHHSYSREENFSNAMNYSFGGLGLQGHIADRLMGKFQPLERFKESL